MNFTNDKKTPHEHISSIFEEYTTPSRVLRSFTNISNTVIQTALSGQNKFLFEILQNADDSFDDEHRSIEMWLHLVDNFLIVMHTGKGFDYNDVERICDYASQIEEVKATDLSKTGYKGLGFKSLFNVSDCIYIHSNDYSFCFDKNHWSDWSSRPWQVIPIWCARSELPRLHEGYFNYPVTLILKVNDVDILKQNLKELVDQPEVLLYLNRINKLDVRFGGRLYCLEKSVNKLGLFNKVSISKDKNVVSTWLTKTYELNVPQEIRNAISGGSRFIYPDKIKTAEKVPFTFALRSNEIVQEISIIEGLCYNAFPTQLRLALPYHINSFFILSLDRTQLLENEWNEFLLRQMGHLQLCLLADLAELPHLKNDVIRLFVRKIEHPFSCFRDAFLEGFNESKNQIAWLPPYQGCHLLKLGEAWIDETMFFKQNFQHIEDKEILQSLIDYNVKKQNLLSHNEAKRFTYDLLVRDFSQKYYPQLIKTSFVSFITYLYDNRQPHLEKELRRFSFLLCKNEKLVSPPNAFLEESENLVPDFLLMPKGISYLVDNRFLPSENSNLIKDWLVTLGAKRLETPEEVVRESILKWLNTDFPTDHYEANHFEILSYIASCYEKLTFDETKEMKSKLRILTESGKFEKADQCYFSDVVSIEELAGVVSRYKISSCYSTYSLKMFFIRLGVHNKLDPFDVLKKIISWIEEDEIKDKITSTNYATIIEYISQHYPSIKNKLTNYKQKTLKKFPVLTENNTFRESCKCFWPSESFINTKKKIPGLESVISTSEIVSSNCCNSDKIKHLLGELGVRNLNFINIYEKYSDNLIDRENVKWFFSELKDYWKKICTSENVSKNKLLKYLQQKFKSSSCLLATDGNMYSSKELYSTKFRAIHNIDPTSVPLLDLEDCLPTDMELCLGFKMELEVNCIMSLYETISSEPKLGEEKTRLFFSTLLEQLRHKKKDEVKKYSFRLLSRDNKLLPAKALYYFEEKNATCHLGSCYLKRIHGMSHDETLQLAKLCGVNVLRFKRKLQLKDDVPDDTLKEFLLKRLPFFVLQESQELNESKQAVLERLYKKICSIKLYQCSEISVKYPFGAPCKIPFHFQGLKIYTTSKWNGWKKSNIFKHLRRKLVFKTDITQVVDMDFNSEDRKEWLRYKMESIEKYHSIEKRVEELRLKKVNQSRGLPRDKFDRSVHSLEKQKHISGKFCKEQEFVSREYYSSDVDSSDSCSRASCSVRRKRKRVHESKTSGSETEIIEETSESDSEGKANTSARNSGERKRKIGSNGATDAAGGKRKRVEKSKACGSESEDKDISESHLEERETENGSSSKSDSVHGKRKRTKKLKHSRRRFTRNLCHSEIIPILQKGNANKCSRRSQWRIQDFVKGKG